MTDRDEEPVGIQPHKSHGHENELLSTSGRNGQIDLLRFIGLSMIILAHVYPPTVIFQIRNFDVPLMVIIAGMSFSIASREEAYGSYVWRRIKRLLFPVWIFLTVYYFVVWSLGLSWELLDLRTVVSSYLLFDGIGFVWIIRVFLIIALLAPYINFLNKVISGDTLYMFTLFVYFMVCELLRYVICSDPIENPETNPVVIFLSVFPYIGLFALGIRLKNLRRRHIFRILLLVFTLFLILAFYYHRVSGYFVPTQVYKYPPSVYYLSYAIFVSVSLWLVSRKVWCVLTGYRVAVNLVSFIAGHTIWIYMWHIPMLYIFDTNFALKYILVFSAAVVMVFLQKTIIVKYVLPELRSEVAKKNIKTLFFG